MDTNEALLFPDNMGARQSKRSVDITTTPKKGEIDGQPLDGKLEKIEDGVEKPAQANGATHLPPDAQVSYPQICNRKFYS